MLSIVWMFLFSNQTAVGTKTLLTWRSRHVVVESFKTQGFLVSMLLQQLIVQGVIITRMLRTLMPTLDRTQWQPCDPPVPSIWQPLYKRGAGRPRKNRIEESMPQDK